MSLRFMQPLLPTNALLERRRSLRYAAALLSGIVAVIYFLIGLQVLTVLDTPEDQLFGIFAGAAYALGVILLLAFDHRLLWIIGALLQAFVIFTYFDLASQRSPAFEVWGIVLRVLQFMLLLALLYIEMRLPLHQPD